MKKLLYIFIIVLIFGCNAQTELDVETDTTISTDKDMDRGQIDWKFELMDENNIEVFETGNLQITINNPYKNKGPLELKGSMHNHTDNSLVIDKYPSGDPYLTAVKFKDEGGYHFYTFTDHNFVTEDPGVPGIVWMGSAVEDTKHTQHLVVYNLPDNYQWVNNGTDIQGLINYYSSLGGIISYAHPDSPSWIQSDSKILSVENIDFVEIINVADGSQERALDLLLSKGLPVFGFAVDDYHFNKTWEDPNWLFDKAYIIAFAEEKEKSSIWRALLSGSFYAATTGKRIDIHFENGVIHVSSNGAATFEFIGLNTENPGSGKVLSTFTNVQEALYTINGNEGYVRVRVTGPSGMAFSQPLAILSVIEN